MLQLIGWLGCLYLFIKGFEFLAHDGYRREHGDIKGPAVIAVVAAWLGAAVFFFAFAMQGLAAPDTPAFEEASEIENKYPEKSPAWHDCVTQAKDAVEAAACKDVQQ